MSFGSLVRLTHSLGGVPAGSCGRVKGFYRRPERTDVVVRFGCGRTELVPETSLLPADAASQPAARGGLGLADRPRPG